MQQPLPDATADAIVQVLARSGAYARGAVLDLRH
jgi:hypothetical protein